MSLHDIFDLSDDRYTAQVAPESYPNQPQPVLKNWSAEDLEMYCGIYTKDRRLTLRAAQLLGISRKAMALLLGTA